MRNCVLTLLVFCTPCSAAVRGFWTKARVTQGIQLLHSTGITIDAKTVRAGKPGSACAQALAGLHPAITGPALYKAASRLWPKTESFWDEAMRAAGFDPDAHRLESSWNEKLFAQVVAELHRLGIPLNQMELRREEWQETIREVTQEVTKHSVGGRGVVSTGIRLHKGWNKAVMGLGLPGFDWRTLYPQVPWTPEKVDAAIRALHAAGVDLSPGAVSKDLSAKLTAILERAIGLPVTAAALFDRAKFYNGGSWKKALEKNGIDWKKIYKREPFLQWTDDLVLAVLRELHAAGNAINYEAFTTRRTFRVSEELRERLGLHPSGYAILGASTSRFGTHYRALSLAGFAPATGKKSGVLPSANVPLSKERWTPDKVLHVLETLQACGRQIGWRELVRSDDAAFDEAVQQATGFMASPNEVIAEAQAAFGSYEKALARLAERPPRDTIAVQLEVASRAFAVQTGTPMPLLILELAQYETLSVPPEWMAKTFAEETGFPVTTEQVVRAAQILKQLNLRDTVTAP